MKPQQYAERMKENFGRDRALKLAKEAVEHSSPSEWPNLPVGEVFYKRVEGNRVTERERETLRSASGKQYVLDITRLEQNHHFWLHVCGILGKMKR